jgi:uncharacterized protein (DUF1684 family)
VFLYRLKGIPHMFSKTPRVWGMIVIVTAIQLLSTLPAAAQTAYVQEQEQWRKDQEKDLTQPKGWLSLAGLYWLKEGRNSLGSAATNDLVFPGTGTPPAIGVIEFHQGTAAFTAEPKVAVIIDGKAQSSAKLAADDTGAPTSLQLGSLSWNVIKRGERYGVRLRDSANPSLTSFTGMKWFPVEESFRVVADFTAYETPRTVPITNVLGDVYQMKAPGLLKFKIGQEEFSLEPVLEDEKLFIIFRDLTSGKETYGAGRFLYADAAKDGKVILDFNQSVNPPCAFTPFATCPLPPARNWLKVAIRAGELKYHETGNGVAAEK